MERRFDEILRHILLARCWVFSSDAADYVTGPQGESSRPWSAKRAEQRKATAATTGAFLRFLHGEAKQKRMLGLLKQPKISSQPEEKQLMHVIN